MGYLSFLVTLHVEWLWLTSPVVKRFLLQLVDVVIFLRSQSTIHRDLTSHNIFISRDHKMST